MERPPTIKWTDERRSRETVDAALRDAQVPATEHEAILAAEVRALRLERPGMTTSQIADAITAEVIKQLKEENAELRRQLVAANRVLQNATHERVDPKRDPFGGMGT